MTILAKLAISPISPTSPVQIFTASVVRHIMPLPTLFLASEFYSDISSVDRIVSDSLEIPWWFVSGYATHCLPKHPLTFIYCLIYSLPLGGGPE